MTLRKKLENIYEKYNYILIIPFFFAIYQIVLFQIINPSYMHSKSSEYVITPNHK